MVSSYRSVKFLPPLAAETHAKEECCLRSAIGMLVIKQVVSQLLRRDDRLLSVRQPQLRRLRRWHLREVHVPHVLRERQQVAVLVFDREVAVAPELVFDLLNDL